MITNNALTGTIISNNDVRFYLMHLQVFVSKSLASLIQLSTVIKKLRTEPAQLSMLQMWTISSHSLGDYLESPAQTPVCVSACYIENFLLTRLHLTNKDMKK